MSIKIRIKEPPVLSIWKNRFQEPLVSSISKNLEEPLGFMKELLAGTDSTAFLGYLLYDFFMR